MAEPSTPVEPTVQADGQAPSQQPVENPTADQQPSQPSQDQQPAQTEATPAADPAKQAPANNDDDLSEWAGKQGIDLENPSPEQVKVIAKRWRDTQKAFTESRQALKAAQEFQQDTSNNDLARINEIEDPLERQTAVNTAEVKNMKTSLTVERFFGANPDAIAHRKAMSDIVAKDVESYGANMETYWMNNLDKLADLAKGSTVEAERGAAFEQGRQQERESIARQGQVSTPQPHAVNPTSGRQPITSPAQIRSMPEAERRERSAEIFDYFASL